MSRTWLEWSFENSVWTKTLVVEVEFDTDPKSPEFRQDVIDTIGVYGTWRSERRDNDDRKPLEGRADAGGNVVSCLVLDPRAACSKLIGVGRRHLIEFSSDDVTLLCSVPCCAAWFVCNLVCRQSIGKGALMPSRCRR